MKKPSDDASKPELYVALLGRKRGERVCVAIGHLGGSNE